jgi:hypothetical protein
MLNDVKSRNRGSKIISFMHISLEGFVAGPNGEMNWIKVDEEIIVHVGKPISGVSIVPRWRGSGLIINPVSNWGGLLSTQ